MTPTTQPAEHTKHVHELAARIERALRQDARFIRRDDTEQNIADLDWMADRYQQLRIPHPEGFEGAASQARFEWLEMVLAEALSDLTPATDKQG